MYVVAGPNGAGKSTLTTGARDHFGIEPIDADIIQREQGTGSSAAWHEAFDRCVVAIANRVDFLVETTLAGSDRMRPSSYLQLMEKAKAKGFRIELTFIALENADAHVARVADRVAAGEHDIPEWRIRERYELSLERAASALSIVDHAVFLDNSSVAKPFRLVLEVDRGKLVARVFPLPEWASRILHLSYLHE